MDKSCRIISQRGCRRAFAKTFRCSNPHQVFRNAAHRRGALALHLRPRRQVEELFDGNEEDWQMDNREGRALSLSQRNGRWLLRSVALRPTHRDLYLIAI